MLEDLTIKGLEEKVLCHIAMLRRAQGLPFKKLHVNRSDVSLIYFKRLKEFVQSIEYIVSL